MGRCKMVGLLPCSLHVHGALAAKNLILAGPRSVTVFDPTPTTLTDLQCNYYLTAAHAAR